jgi:F0F1-type ATP synthase alpha subunit
VGISTEISQAIKEVRDFDASLVSADVGRIVAVGDSIAQIYSRRTRWRAAARVPARHVRAGLEPEDQVRSVILSEFGHLHEGDEVRTTDACSGPRRRWLIGRLVNPLGVP